eukprot:19286_3
MLIPGATTRADLIGIILACTTAHACPLHLLRRLWGLGRRLLCLKPGGTSRCLGSFAFSFTSVELCQLFSCTLFSLPFLFFFFLLAPFLCRF